MPGFKPSPNMRALLLARMEPVAEAMAQEAAGFLKEKLSGAGSGLHHPGLPNPSSAPGEYPAEQSGDLLACIGVQSTGPAQYEVGALNSVAPVPAEAWALEYPSPPSSPITRQSPHGARPWLSKALGDEELHDRLRAAAQRTR